MLSDTFAPYSFDPTDLTVPYSLDKSGLTFNQASVVDSVNIAVSLEHRKAFRFAIAVKTKFVSTDNWNEPHVTMWRLNVNIGKEYLEPNCDGWCKSPNGSKLPDVMYVNSLGVCSNLTHSNIGCSVLKTSKNIFSASV
jgi:hypothetical protein